jgi:L-lactate utilization protein LutB
MNTAMGSVERAKLAETFLNNVYATHGGDRIKKCLQCGNCSGSCPTSHLMDYPPRVVFAALRGGELDTVLKSNTIWMCASCYTCQVRCPVQIKITDVMYEMKRLAAKHDLAKPKQHGRILTDIFIKLVNRDGRSSEGILGRTFYMKGPGIFASIKEMPFAISMMLKGRLNFFKHERIKDPGKLARALNKIGGD